MRVFVTGGTGTIGGHVIPVLVWRGRKVTALARTPEKGFVVNAQGATAAPVSLLDTPALSRGESADRTAARPRTWPLVRTPEPFATSPITSTPAGRGPTGQDLLPGRARRRGGCIHRGGRRPPSRDGGGDQERV
jgi:hypothetical protein